jgi:hypothetical protein
VGIHLEVFLAAGYAVFLLGVSLGLDLLARHSYSRSERYRTAGFTYHHKSDAWICPQNQHLTRSEVDHERRLVRYRGRPQVCNHCPSKTNCTDSEEGREVVRAMDPWPHSEAGRFHRGISDCGGRGDPQPLPVRAAPSRDYLRGGRAGGPAPACGLPRQPGELPDTASHPFLSDPDETDPRRL